MDEDDIYGSILSDPKSNSGSSSLNPQSSHSQYNQSHVQQQIPPQSSLFISNMTWWTSEDDLRSAFDDLSHRILQIQFLEHKPNGKSKGMAIVEFADVPTAELAKKCIEGKEMIGKRIWEVSFARNAPVKAYERSYQSKNEYIPREQRQPTRPMRSDPQYSQRSEISYEDHEKFDHRSDYHHQQHKQSTRHVHREEYGYDNRSTRSRESRDSRSRSPDRRSNYSHHDRNRY